MTSTRAPRRASVRLLAVAAAALAGLAGAVPLVPAEAALPDRVPIAELPPLPAAPEVSDAARAARERLLGPHALQPDTVTLHWVGVSSFVVTIGAHLLLFDAWEIIGLHADYLPIGREDLAALEPEAILVGHGHFDHAADVGYVAGRTGAVVVGSEEICQTAKDDAARDGLQGAFTCALTGTAEAPPPGTAQVFRLFADLPPVTVLQHVHSGPSPPGDGNPLHPFLPVFDPVPYLEHLNSDPEELARFVETLPDAQGGTWLYHLVVGDFTLLLGDSAGPLHDHPAVRDALGALPGCVDVMANAILGFDQPVSGLDDPVEYVDAVRPHVFVPTHADAWAPVISAGQEAYVDELARVASRLSHPPEVVWLFDPEDYLRELVFDVTDERWAVPPPGTACAAAAEAPTPSAPTPSPPTPETPVAPDTAPPADAAAPPAPAGTLPATGGGIAVVGALVAGAAWRLRRRGHA